LLEGPGASRALKPRPLISRRASEDPAYLLLGSAWGRIQHHQVRQHVCGILARQLSPHDFPLCRFLCRCAEPGPEPLGPSLPRSGGNSVPASEGKSILRFPEPLEARLPPRPSLRRPYAAGRDGSHPSFRPILFISLPKATDMQAWVGGFPSSPSPKTKPEGWVVLINSSLSSLVIGTRRVFPFLLCRMVT
jgi:hypothetical protein